MSKFDGGSQGPGRGLPADAHLMRVVLGLVSARPEASMQLRGSTGLTTTVAMLCLLPARPDAIKAEMLL
jgi:hypothetical protein